MDNAQFASPVRLLNPRAGHSPVVYGDDSNLFVEFYDEEVYNENQSLLTGRAIWDKAVFCKIIFPADRLKTFIEKVKMDDDIHGPSHPHRFPRQWAAYLAQHEQVPDGSPLETWPPMTKNRVKELKAMHIHTIEQIASLTDQNGPNIGMDWRKLRDMAIATVKPNEGAAEISRLHKMVADLSAKIEAYSMQAMSATEVPRQRKPKAADPLFIEPKEGEKDAD